MSGQTHKSAKMTDNGGTKSVKITKSVKTSSPTTGAVKR